MHELSLCMDILEQITFLALQHRARAVSSVRVKIGALSGVEPLLLQNAFTIAQAGTVAEEAQFITEQVPVRIFCDDCHAESEARPNSLRCSSCGSIATRLTSGDELTLASVELLVDDDPSPPVPVPGTPMH